MHDDGRPVRLDSLTSLRFFAAAIVVVHHVAGAGDQFLADIGFVGVTFFFVLSGFVLTWSESSRHGSRTFYRHRFARIYPLHLLMLAAAFVVPLTQFGGPRAFVENLTLTHAWDPGAVQSYNAVTWTISAEAFFYLLFPWLVRVLARCSTRTLVVTALACWLAQPVAAVVVAVNAQPATTRFVTFFLPAFRLPEFIIGICMALAMVRRARPSRGDAGVTVVTALACAAVAVLLDSKDTHAPFLYGTLVLPAIVVVIWVSAYRDVDRSGSLLTHPVLVRLGAWSFALYMSHLLVLRIVCHLLDEPRTGLLPWWAAIPVLALTTGVAGVLHHAWEQPAERRLRGRAGRARVD